MVSIDFTNVMKNKDAFLTIEEIDRMLQHAYTENKIRDYMLILTLERTGRRITEILGKKPFTKLHGLRPIDIKGDLIEWNILKKQHIKTTDKKGRKLKQETIENLRHKHQPKNALKPVDSHYMELLKQYITTQQITMNERVFPITRRRAQYIIQEIATKLGITRKNSGIHPHMFRHSLTINLLKKYPNNPYILLQAQKILDHSSINVTSTYAQFAQTDIKESLEGLFNTKKQEEEK